MEGSSKKVKMSEGFFVSKDVRCSGLRAKLLEARDQLEIKSTEIEALRRENSLLKRQLTLALDDTAGVHADSRDPSGQPLQDDWSHFRHSEGGNPAQTLPASSGSTSDSGSNFFSPNPFRRQQVPFFGQHEGSSQTESSQKVRGTEELSPFLPLHFKRRQEYTDVFLSKKRSHTDAMTTLQASNTPITNRFSATQLQTNVASTQWKGRDLTAPVSMEALRKKIQAELDARKAAKQQQQRDPQQREDQ
ncbi:MAG: hypothetical protein Q9220_006304 [cf. Caloplaca sp. 1 TL-2023]